MANLYSQVFTLKDIFNNPHLRNKIPLINYRETEKDYGKYSIRTHMKTVRRHIFESAISAAKPYYSPLNVIKGENTLILSGDLIGGHDNAVEAVYSAIMSRKSVIQWTASNGKIIRDALKESEKNRRIYGIKSPLYLRTQSMLEINGMTKQQIEGLLDNVMENIIFGDDFPETQRKYNVKENFSNERLTYEQQKLRWKYRVGDL